MKPILIWISGCVLGVIVTSGLWFYVAVTNSNSMTDMTGSTGMDAMTDMQAIGERQPLYWVAPMDANYRRNEPGLSPMGMPLIPVYESGDTITVAASIQQNLGVRTATAVRSDFTPIIDAVGYTGWDESSIQMLHTRAEGWLEVFNLASVGDQVQAGDVLYELFAPNLVSVQREFLTTRASGNQQLTAIARDRLFALGITQLQVEELERSSTVSNRLQVRAEQDATITHIGVRQGNYVELNTPLATLASLDKVWIETEVFESMAVWIETGLQATVSFTAFPGENWSTDIAYIYPNLDATTRSLRLRLVVDNGDQRLRPNMFANVQIASKPKLNVLTVPREAVIRAGSGARVIVALGQGKFRPQVVQTGVASGYLIEIISGLEAGDIVVTSGQFLLDSEANGEQAFARLADSAPDSQATAVNMNMPMTTASNQGAVIGAEANNTNSTEPTYNTVGVISQIVAGATITIAHEPVAALGWPAMVMGFQVPVMMNISGLAVGDAVAFEFVITPQGAYQLTTITERDEPEENPQ